MRENAWLFNGTFACFSENDDETMESITTEDDGACDDTLEDNASEECNSEEDDEDEDEEDEDEDEDCSGEVNDLLDKALTDEPTVVDKKQPVPEEHTVCCRHFADSLYDLKKSKLFRNTTFVSLRLIR